MRAHSVSAGHGHQRLRELEQPPLRHAVGEQAAPGAEQQHRQELQRGGEADRDAVPVSCTISHISATICIQLPEIETTWPAK